MCGIVGIHHPKLGAPEREAILQRMLDALKHRGPDDEGRTSQGSFSLGHRRLSIIDTSSDGRQPMSNEDGSLWMVANGEIYNFNELRPLLESKGHRFRSKTDTEMILHLYEDYGEESVNHLRGMFAYALVNAKENRLILARDRMGIKPLYYFQDGPVFLFASEIGALLGSGLIPRRLDPQAVDLYVSFGYVPPPVTLIQGIRALEAGDYLVFDRGKTRVEKYWRPPLPDASAGDADTWPERLREILEESIRIHCVSDVPLGAFLSGGIDSSAVVGLMSRILPHPIRTFSIGFDSGPARLNELKYARLAASRFRTDHREVIVTGKEIGDRLEAMIGAIDQPSFDGINTYLVSQAARRGGLTVALSGLGGDELFGGYSTYRFLPRWGRWFKTWGMLPEPARRALLAVLRRSLRMKEARFRKLDRFAEVTSPLEAYAALSLNTWEKEKEDLYSPAFRDSLHRNGNKSNQEVFDLLRGCLVASGDLWRLVTELELRNYMNWRLLRDTDAMSMAHSLEVRVPLIDHKVVEFVCRLPYGWHRRWGYPKRLLVAALGDLLPDEIVHRTKQGFQFPLDDWMRGTLRTRVEEILAPASLEKAGYFSAKGMSRLYREFQAGHRSYESVWKFVILELWRHHHAAS